MALHQMVDEEQYCIDILTPISALTKALDGVAIGLLGDHLKHCVVDAAKIGGGHGHLSPLVLEGINHADHVVTGEPPHA